MPEQNPVDVEQAPSPIQCTRDPQCERGLHDSPCGKLPPPAGSPCDYCGKPLPAQEGAPQYASWCRDCCRAATITDLKALAAEQGWDSTVTTGEPR